VTGARKLTRRTRTPRSQPCASATAPDLICVWGFRQRARTPRGETSRQRGTTATAYAGLSPGTSGSPGDHDSIPDPETKKITTRGIGPAHSPVPAPLPPDLICVWGFRQRARSRRGETSRQRGTTATAYAGLSPGDAGFTRRSRFCSGSRNEENHDPGHGYRAQGCERGVRVRLVSFHAPVTGRLAGSRGRLGARGAAARRETLTGESPCVSRRS